MSKFKNDQIGHYQLEKNLGEGNFAKVKLATHTLTKEKVAIKIIDKNKLDAATSQKLFREVRIMKLLNQPHIVKLYEVIDTPDELYLIMEYVSGGEIFDYLVAHGRMKEDAARKHFRQIVSAVHHCHNLKIIHRDLKAENILLDDKFNIKIADFGFSTQFRDGAKLNTWCGSPPYAAPELFQGKEYSGPEVDVWSLGVILFVLVCGSLPFDAQNLPKLRAKIISGKYKVPYYMSPGCEALIKKMLIVEPSERISLDDLKKDKWFSDGNYSDPIISPQISISESLHEDVLKCLENLGLDRDEVVRAVKSNTYNHFLASYYLIADRELRKMALSNKNKLLPGTNTDTLKNSSTDNERKQVINFPNVDALKLPHLPEISEEDSIKPSRIADDKEITIGDHLKSSATSRRRRSEEPSSTQKPAPISNNIVRVTARRRSSTVGDSNKAILELNNEKTKPQETNKKADILPALVNRATRNRSKTVGGTDAKDAISEIISETFSKNGKSDDPRSLRFTFSVSTTSTKGHDHIKQELERVLKDSKVGFKKDGWLFHCEIEDLQFEIEICKIPRLSVNGLKVKRLTGNSWDYKNLLVALVDKMDL